MAESARAGPTDLNGAGPSSPRRPSPSPTVGMPLDVAMQNTDAATLNSESQVDSVNTINQPGKASSTATNTIAARMDPPDSIRPPSRDTDIPNGVHFASVTQSIIETTVKIDTEYDQAMSPAGSTSTTKSRNKRKRPHGKPAHFMGMGNNAIRCICDYTHGDGLTTQCDACGAWVHGPCFDYNIQEEIPDKFYCHLEQTPPLDRQEARRRQEELLASAGHPEEDDLDPVQPRPKGKRQKSEIAAREEGPSPTTSKPPSLPNKPKRPRSTALKPKQAKANITDNVPSSTIGTGPVALDAGRELDDPFFKDSWELQYSYLKANIPKGWKGEAALKKLRAEWQGDIDEEVAENGRVPAPDSDFSTLGAPVPPISFITPDLDSLGAPVHVRLVRDHVNFLPGQYEELLDPGDLSHPSRHAIFANGDIRPGDFIGEYRGEVGSSANYRQDPYNQYALLGVPKPYVRAVGPPLDLCIDARSWGTNLRYIRSSCHPNAVLRLIRWRKSETEPATLGFGVFASTDIDSDAEITLAWDWDDRHIVHAVSAALQDGNLAAIDVETSESITSKCESTLLTMYGVFATCACPPTQFCAFERMQAMVDHREMLARNGGPIDLGELVGAVRGFRRHESVAKVRRREAGWGIRPPSVEPVEQVVEPVEQVMEHVGQAVEPVGEAVLPVEEAVVEVSKVEDVGQIMDVDDVPAVEDEDIVRVQSPGMDVDTEPRSPEAKSPEQPTVSSTTIPPSSPLSLPPSQMPPQEPACVTAPDQLLGLWDDEESNGSPESAPRKRKRTDVPAESEVKDGHESDATTITQARSTFSDSGSEDERPPTPPRADSAIMEDAVVKQENGNSNEPAQVQTASTSRSATRASSEPPDIEDYDDAEIVAEPPKDLPKTVKAAPKSRSKILKAKKEVKRTKLDKAVRKVARVSTPKTRSVSPTKAAAAAEKKPTPQAESDTDSEWEIRALEHQEPIKPPPPPPKNVSLAEYLKRKKEMEARADVPAGQTTTAAATEPTAPHAVEKVKPELVDDGGIPGFKHMSPIKPPEPLPPVNGSSDSPATRQAELDNHRFNLFDHLPSHGTPDTSVGNSTTTTPGLGLTRGDYFPPQSTISSSSSYVPRVPGAPRPSYVPRAQGSISRTSESPMDDHLPKGSTSAQQSSTPLPRVTSNSYVPRPSPLSEHAPLPSMSMSQSNSSSSSNQHRASPYRSTSALPEPTIPPVAIREPPPHASFRPPPTGPKVPPKGPRTSGGSAASGGFVPPRDRDRERDRDRDWDARDRDRERERERDRERDRDREPVSPRATFGVGSARGGAPVPIPFHRGRGRGGYRGRVPWNQDSRN